MVVSVALLIQKLCEPVLRVSLADELQDIVWCNLWEKGSLSLSYRIIRSWTRAQGTRFVCYSMRRGRRIRTRFFCVAFSSCWMHFMLLSMLFTVTDLFICCVLWFDFSVFMRMCFCIFFGILSGTLHIAHAKNCLRPWDCSVSMRCIRCVVASDFEQQEFPSVKVIYQILPGEKIVFFYGDVRVDVFTGYR